MSQGSNRALCIDKKNVSYNSLARNFSVSCWWLSSSVWRWSSYAEVAFQRHPETAGATNTQQTWRQEFLGSRSSNVERSFTRTAVAGTSLRFLQTIFENTSLWPLKRLVTLSTYRRYINKCIYLSIYLHVTIYNVSKKFTLFICVIIP